MVPVPKLSRTPPRNSLLAKRSWFHMHSSRLRSANSWWLTSSKTRVLFHSGFEVRRLMIVLCLVVLPFSGNKVLFRTENSMTYDQPDYNTWRKNLPFAKSVNVAIGSGSHQSFRFFDQDVKGSFRTLRLLGGERIGWNVLERHNDITAVLRQMRSVV